MRYLTILLLTVFCCLTVHAESNTFTPVLTNFPPKDWHFENETLAIVQAAYTQPQQVVSKPLHYNGAMTAVMIQRSWLFTWKEKKLRANEVLSIFKSRSMSVQYVSQDETFEITAGDDVVLKWIRKSSTEEPLIEAVLQPKGEGLIVETYTHVKGIQQYRIAKLPHPYGHGFQGIKPEKLSVGDVDQCSDYDISDGEIVSITEKVTAKNPAPTSKEPWVARIECQEGNEKPFEMDLDADNDMICLRAGRVELRLCSLEAALKDCQ